MLRNSAPSSALAADAATHFNMVHKVILAPLILMGQPSTGREPRKNIPPALLRALLNVMYNASKWMLSTMSDSWYNVFLSGFDVM